MAADAHRMAELRGKVTALDEQEATIQLDDGTQRTVDVPDLIEVEVGMSVRVIDVGDERPIYGWGLP